MSGLNIVIKGLTTPSKGILANNNIAPLLWYKGGFGQLMAENDFSN